MKKTFLRYFSVLLAIFMCITGFASAGVSTQDIISLIDGEAELMQISDPPEAPEDVSGVRYYFNKTFSAKPSGTEEINGTSYTWGVAGSVAYDESYNALKHAGYVKATYANAITKEGEYKYSLDFMAPDMNFGEKLTYSFYLGSYKIAAVETGGKLYLAQQDSGITVSSGKWYRVTADISLPSGDVASAITDMSTGDVLASKTQTGRCTSFNQFSVTSNVVPVNSIYTQNWRLYSATEKTDAPEDGEGDEGGITAPTSAPEAPADVQGATYYFKKNFSAKPSGEETMSGASYSWASAGTVAYNTEYNAMEHSGYMKATYSNPFSGSGNYKFSIDVMAPDTSYGDNTTYTVYLGAYKIASFENGGKLYIAQQDSGVSITAGKWYRINADTNLELGDVSVSITDIAANNVIATKSQTGKLTSITQISVQSNVLPQKYMYTQNWRLYTTDVQQGGDEGGNEGGGDVPSGPVELPPPPSEVPGAVYYMNKTFTGAPSGQEKMNSVIYTWGKAASVVYDSEQKALQHNGYVNATLTRPIAEPGEYVYAFDIMMKNADFGAANYGLRINDGSANRGVFTILNGGKTQLNGKDSGVTFEAGIWYTVRSKINLEDASLVMELVRRSDSAVLASKKFDNVFTGGKIASVQISANALTDRGIYTNYWQLYSPTGEKNPTQIEPITSDTDLAKGLPIDFYCAMNKDMYPNRTGMELATDSNDETYFDTGRISYHDTISGPQIAPFIKLDGVEAYNKIRIRHSAETSQNAPFSVLLRVSTSGPSSSAFQTIGTYTSQTDVDTVLRFQKRSEPFIGYHFNAGTDDVGKWETSLKIYSIEVYYDGGQIESFSLPDKVVASAAGDVTTCVNAINADGNQMSEFKDYSWSVEKIFGCAGVELNEETGEITIPSDTTSGQMKITITHNEDATLSFTDTVSVFAHSDNLEDLFAEVKGSDKIIIPAIGENKAIYQVIDSTGKESNFKSMITWKLDKEYPGVNISGSEITVSKDATPGEITMIADADGFEIRKTVILCPTSGAMTLYPSEVTGRLFIVSPYYGEEEVSVAQYKAIDFDGNEMTNVTWSLKGAPKGVTVSDKGLVTVPAGITATEIKVIASIGDVAAEKRVNIVERYEGAPNLLRLDNANISISGAQNEVLAYDGNFATASNNAQAEGFKYIDMTLSKNYDIDVFRIYKDFGGVYASAQVNCRVGADAFGGKGWVNAPLESETWNPAPAFNTNNLKYGMTTTYHGIDVYEIELYSSYMRFASIDMPSDSIAIPSGGINTMTLTAKAENGDELSTVTYTDGEVHPLKWMLLYPAKGVSIDEVSGEISVTSDAEPTVVTVEATYFGRRVTASVKIGSGNKAKMDYDWLTFEKLSSQKPESISYKMTLPHEGICGSSITWKSSNPAFLTEYGDVYIPYDTGDKNITLTATISANGNTLVKTFDVTIPQPDFFEDLSPVSDRELFGLWDAENEEWAVKGKFDYSVNSAFGKVEEAVKALDYTKAKELLLEITKDKLTDPVYTANASKTYGDPLPTAYSNYVTVYGTNMLSPISIGNERKWYSHDVKSVLDTHLRFNIILQSEMKENAEVEIDSKESDFVPYIVVKFSNGTEKRYDVLKDTTLRAGYFRNENYGGEKVMKVMDYTGYPIDGTTKRAYMYFDLSDVETDDVSSAELFIHGQNVSQTGDKKLYVVYNVSEWDEMNECWTTAKVNDSLYSYSSPENKGFSYSFSPGGDAEVTYQQNGGRLYYLRIIAAGFPITGNEKYAYTSYQMIDNYFRTAGECETYPRALDSNSRNNCILMAYKLCANSQYLTTETATLLWKHIWRQQEEMMIGRDPFWHGNTGNIAISLSEYFLKTTIEFSEFTDVTKWTDFYLGVMQPIMETSILTDGSYVEAADGYATGSIQTFANSVIEAKNAGINLGLAFDERIHSSTYNYAALRAPGFAGLRFGDSWTNGGNATSDNFLVKMAKLYNDDELLYIGAYGNQGGTKPDNATLYFPNTRRAFMRSEWSEDASYLMINADDGFGGHAHEDDLSIIAYAYGDFVITDTSVLSYATDDVSQLMKKSPQHNTLGRITDVKTGNVSTQAYKGEVGKTKVVSWQSDNEFDYYSANIKPNLYTDRNTGYNRKVLFIKPGYWIVSDYVQDNEPEGRTENKYDIMFHFMPDSRPEIDGTTVKTDSDSTNVHLVTPDEDVSVAFEDAYYTDKVGSYVMTQRAVYSRTEDAKKPVTFDTVVFPSANGDKTVDISAKRLPMDVGTEVASAMHISRKDKTGEFDDYYYYTNEKNFDSKFKFAERSFGDFTFDGELSYQSYSKSGKLKSALMISGTRLVKNEDTVISIDVAADMFDVTVDNSVMYISCSEDDVEALGNIVIDVNDKISGVYYNSKPVKYVTSSDGKIMLGSSVIKLNTEITTEESGESYISLSRINFGGKFEYDGKSYSVNVDIPEGTKIKPEENWDGLINLEITSAKSGKKAGEVNIKAVDGRKIEFLTPYSIYVEQHASADVYTNGRKVAGKASSNDPSNAELKGDSALLFTNRDKLWIITNSTAIEVNKIKDVSLPESVGGGSSGGGAGGGSTTVIPGGTPVAPPSDVSTEVFTDLGNVSWAKEAIMVLYDRKVVNGTGNGLFAPDNPVTRAEFVTMIVRAFNLTSADKSGRFTDVADGMWYTDAINTAASLGIVNGVSDNVFDINAQITRQDIMVILYRTLNYMGMQTVSDGNVTIADFNMISDYAKSAVMYMVGEGIVNGVGENKVAPQDIATRAQSAKIIYGVLNIYDKH